MFMEWFSEWEIPIILRINNRVKGLSQDLATKKKTDFEITFWELHFLYNNFVRDISFFLLNCGLFSYFFFI